MRFLYWNLKKRDLSNQISSLLDDNQPDIAVFSEARLDPDKLIKTVNSSRRVLYSPLIFNLKRSPIILTKLPSNCFVSKISPAEERFSMFHISPPLDEDFLLGVIHYLNPMGNSEASLVSEAVPIVRDVIEIENALDNYRTILVGDFNINPFHPAMVGARQFNATPSMEIARRRPRSIGKDKFRYFFNPMWRRFGDHEFGPPGTYYRHNASESVLIHWNMIDQMIVRPSLIDKIDWKSLKILKKAGGLSLLTKTGIIDQSVASDHLPISFSLDMKARGD